MGVHLDPAVALPGNSGTMTYGNAGTMTCGHYRKGRRQCLLAGCKASTSQRLTPPSRLRGVRDAGMRDRRPGVETLGGVLLYWQLARVQARFNRRFIYGAHRVWSLGGGDGLVSYVYEVGVVSSDSLV